MTLFPLARIRRLDLRPSPPAPEPPSWWDEDFDWIEED